ncbi:hypothetical protein Q8A64_16800, partial [Oxalobacteraceae bacterium R-40]|nr:hypothetical protein [Oxalobacteraceae bacterium R-40]
RRTIHQRPALRFFNPTSAHKIPDTSIAALTRIIEAVIRNERSVLTVSTLLQGQYGLEDVCLSLPAIVGKNGVEKIITVPLSESEQQQLNHSAKTIRETLASIVL